MPSREKVCICPRRLRHNRRLQLGPIIVPGVLVDDGCGERAILDAGQDQEFEVGGLVEGGEFQPHDVPVGVRHVAQGGGESVGEGLACSDWESWSMALVLKKKVAPTTPITIVNMERRMSVVFAGASSRRCCGGAPRHRAAEQAALMIRAPMASF